MRQLSAAGVYSLVLRLSDKSDKEKGATARRLHLESLGMRLAVCDVDLEAS